MYYLIYKITNLVNQKFYVGAHATSNPDDTYMGSGVRIKNAMKKYGADSFKKEILHTLTSSEEMYAKEAELVTEDFISRKDVYNMHVGGRGAPTGNVYGKKTWRTGNESVAFKEGNKAALGRKHSEKAKRLISDAKIGNQHARGKVRSEETKLKISLARTGKKYPRKNTPTELSQSSKTED